MKQLEKIFKALGNKRRLNIIKTLAKSKELPAGEIARQLNLSFASTSKHLAMLYRLDILDRRQENLTIYYRLSESVPIIVKKLVADISNARE